jgi:ATP-dependent DNA ligase
MTSQQTGGREGEVWRLINSPYLGGKNARNGDLEPIVRTKYLQTRDVVVTGFTASGATKLVRAFAAIQVADPETGVPLGNVGTGFTQAQQAELLAGFAAAQAAGRSFIIEIASQGVTEFNVLWHPRFVGIKEE